MPSIFAFGNPLLDIVVQIKDNHLLDKYGLPPNGRPDIPKEDYESLIKDVQKYDQHLSPGGCAQNTMRTLQWLLQENKCTFFSGSVGKDKQAIDLKNLVEQCGVTTIYVEQEEYLTGTALLLTQNENRCAVAYLAAAEHYSIENLQGVLSAMSECDYIYLEAFFTTFRMDTSKYIAQYCKDNGKLLIFNLCSEYICENDPEDIMQLAEQADILIGNKEEFLSLGKQFNMQNLPEILLKLCSVSDNNKFMYKKIIIATDGHKEITCIYNGSVLIQDEVPKLLSNEIIDTTGAGDAFLAGFMYALLFCNKDVRISLKWACWTAKQIIKQLGVNIPQCKPTEILSIA